MKHQLILTALLLFGSSTIFAQNVFEDDIYYNPAKDKSSQQKKEKKQKKSNYIADMSEMDVDAYNRRGESYYPSPVDTIGSNIENGEDFVYTQQIQKYYNPTIVVDNADLLGDVLSNAYGNVEIVINDNGIPVFSPYYYGSPYYSWWTSPSWRFNYGYWGWNIGFYDPWYAWNWGPAYRPGSWGPYPTMASWRPNGNRPAGARPGWSTNTRPGGNLAHRVPGNGTRPGSVSRPVGTSSRPNGVRPGHSAGVNNNNGRWEYNTTSTTGHRQPGTGVVNSGSSHRNYGTASGQTTTGHRNTGVTNSNRNTNNNRSYNNTNSGSRNNGSYSPSRSNGGNFGGARSTGGGSRSGGGRGGRR